jgi:hypothetical protein
MGSAGYARISTNSEEILNEKEVFSLWEKRK